MEVIPETLDKFCDYVFENFDESHDKNHHLKVLSNVREIICRGEYRFTEEEISIMTYASMLHDSLDHKYINSWRKHVDRDEILKFMISELGEFNGNICIHIIENISWSKEMNGLTTKLEDRDILRQIVQDADWLEALGEIGIRRCELFRKTSNFDKNKSITEEQIKEDIKSHIHEKLLLIPRRLNTESAYLMSLKHIQPLLNYIEQ